MQQINTLKPITTKDLIAENTAALEQLCHLIDQLSSEAFCHPFEAPEAPTVGRHVRHILDHYNSFCTAMKPDMAHLDYENRERHTSIEQCPHAARTKLGAICAELEILENTSHENALRIRYPTDAGAIAMNSSVGRELTFLTSHTVHHMAIIALLVSNMRVEVHDGFGVHPSTQRYQQRSAQDSLLAG